MNNAETVKVLDGTGQVEQHTAGITLCIFVGRRNGIKEIAALEKRVG